MGCGCGKTKGAQAFTLRMPDGTTSLHATKLEAQAANSRKGGGGRITTKT